MQKERVRKSKNREVAKPQPVDVAELHSCQYVDWYKFKACQIRTCKNFTDATASKCLAIDRVKPAGAKTISDAELNLYKLQDLNISTRFVQIKRKKAMDRVKHLLALKSFVDYLLNTYSAGAVFDVPSMLIAEQEYPLKIKRLGWKNWMWEYLLDENTWKEFVEKNKGECRDFEVQQLLALSPAKYEKLMQEFNLQGSTK